MNVIEIMGFFICHKIAHIDDFLDSVSSCFVIDGWCR